MSHTRVTCTPRPHPVDNFGTAVGENPDCLLLSGTVVGENPDHVCWASDFTGHPDSDRDSTPTEGFHASFSVVTPEL